MVREQVGADLRRFGFAFAGDLWMSDAMHGPSAGDGRGTRRKTRLLATLDDASRVCPYGAFAFSERTPAFLLVLREAVMRRGIPVRLYVDNGATFRSLHLELVCAKLGIALIHARPFHPAGRGKIERWFRTVRSQFLTTLEEQDTRTLETLNRRFRAWVEGEYHHTPHRGLDNLTPLDKWAECGGRIRYPGPEIDLEDLFLFEARRRVSKARTVSLNNRLYELDAGLAGQRVVLRYDPLAPPQRPLRVVHDGKPAGEAKLLDLYGNAHVKRGGGKPLSFRALDPEED